MAETASKDMDSSPKWDSEVGPTEDVVQALLNYLVDPVLPSSKSSARKAPSFSQQQSVAKQMHAVVLLYNYYQRKRHSVIEFLGFESFCKLAVILKPTLMAHMKLMHRSDYTELDDLENQLSLTERAIMDACDISSVLDASKDVPSTEGWPISKVAVLLVDSRRENCLLVFSSITHGVWSVIEKDLDVSNICSESMVKNKHIRKRKRITNKHELNADEAGLQQLAFLAVKEAAGINQTDFVVLESHVVYSLSKEKTAAHFYIVQCSEVINEELQVPLKDAVESLQGPLVKKSSRGWTVTPVVQYLHVLPYAGILSDWLSREVFSNSLQNLRVEAANVDGTSSHRAENPCSIEVTEDKDESKETYGVPDCISNEARGANSESSKQKDNNSCQTTCLYNSVDGPHSMDAGYSSVVCPQSEDKSKSTCNVVKVYHHKKKKMTSPESEKRASTSDVKVKVEMVDSRIMSCITKSSGEEVDTENKIRSTILSDQDVTPTGDGALVPFKLNSKNLENLQVTLASKENALSQTALRVLRRKREKLSHQLRNLEDEIALCNKNIQTLLDGGIPCQHICEGDGF